jgi:mannan endo-1,4-beta-mannosidase
MVARLNAIQPKVCGAYFNTAIQQALSKSCTHALKITLLLLLVVLNVHAQSFIQRNGTHLSLDGKPFRYSGPNIEWLGLEGYGPHDPRGPRFPSHFEIDDAFATAAEMGASVVRSQTIGDTVGCSLCIEPEQGKFNENAFQASDYALAVASKHHIRLIVSLIGDCATCSGGGIGQFLAWNQQPNAQVFFTDPKLIAAFERHVDVVLNHRNAITGVLYRDDPTIMAWENCNMCGLITMLSHGKAAELAAWSETIGNHIKQLDHRHLYLDSSGIFRDYPSIVDNPSTDVVSFEEYPHWDAAFGIPLGYPPTTAETFSRDAFTVTSHGKAFIVNEFGWDRTNWKSASGLQHLLDTLTSDPNISGDGFWALQAHLDNFGFQPTPADSRDPKFAVNGECGEWWALYYPGIPTLAMSAEDMGARAQQLRNHAYLISGRAVPKHAVPPAPAITSIVVGELIAWRGSAAATRYTIERYDKVSKGWLTICDKCARDTDDPWADPAPVSGAQYRITAFNVDDVASQPSQPR